MCEQKEQGAPGDVEDALAIERHQDMKRGIPPFISQSFCGRKVGSGWCWRIKGHAGSCYPGLSVNP